MPPRPIKYLWTAKGDILGAIINYGAGDLGDIEEIFEMKTSEYGTGFKEPFNELIQEGDIFLNEHGYYEARPELVEDYTYFEQNMHEYLEPPIDYDEEYTEQDIKIYPNIISSVKSWVQLQKPEIVYQNEHFYLEGHYLDSFTRFILTNAFNIIIVVNPFFDFSTSTQLIVKAKQNGKTVVMVTRPPRGPHFKKLHETLEKQGISLLYHVDLHAKLIVIDDLLAVVSSMNFQQRASAGITWEAGLVTMNKEIVDSIKSSIADLHLQPNR